MIQSIVPNIKQRVDIDSVFSITYADLDVETITEDNIIFATTSDEGVSFDVGYFNGKITISLNEKLTTNTIYYIRLTDAITTGGTPIVEEEIKFLTNTLDKDEVFRLGSENNSLNILLKSSLIDKLLDVEWIIEESNIFNFSYNQTNYDAVSKEYTVSDTVIEINNQDTFREELRKNLLHEFEPYFESIDKNKVISDAEFKKIKNNFLRLAYQINTGTGIRKLMDYLFRTYANALGYYLVEIQPDQKDFFTYHITTDLPREYWVHVLADIIHPFSFKEIYNEILQLVDNRQTEEMDIQFSKFFGSVETVLSGNDGLVLIGSNVLQTNIDLSDYPNDATKTNDGLSNRYVLYVTEGINKGIYRIVDNTSYSSQRNTITLFENDTFLKSESAVNFEIKQIPLSLVYDYNILFSDDGVADPNFNSMIPTINESGSFGSEIYTNTLENNYVEPQDYSELLRFYWYTKFITKAPFNFIEAGRLGSSGSDALSKLVFNAVYGHLEFVFESTDTNNDFVSGDIRISKNDSANNPFLFIDSTGTWQTSELTLGNTTFELDKVISTQVNNVKTFDITEFEEPISSGPHSGWQGIFLKEVGGADPIFDYENTISPTHSVFTSGTVTENTLTDANARVLFVDYVNQRIFVNNPTGVAEIPSNATITHNKESLINHVLYSIPTEFSFDGNLLNGYSALFSNYVIDPADSHRSESFKFRYAEYYANVNENLITYEFLNSLPIEKSEIHTDLIQYNGVFTFSSTNVGYLYEFPETLSADDSSVFTGTPVAFCYYISDTDLILKMLPSKTIDPLKYYSTTRKLILHGDANLGSVFTNPIQISSRVKLGLACSLSDFTWGLTVGGSTGTEVFKSDGNKMIIYKEQGKTYDVDLDAITFSFVEIGSTGEVTFNESDGLDYLSRTIGNWETDGLLIGAKIIVSSVSNTNQGVFYIDSFGTESDTGKSIAYVREEFTFYNFVSTESDINNNIQFFNPIDNILTQPELKGV